MQNVNVKKRSLDLERRGSGAAKKVAKYRYEERGYPAENAQLLPRETHHRGSVFPRAFLAAERSMVGIGILLQGLCQSCESGEMRVARSERLGRGQGQARVLYAVSSLRKEMRSLRSWKMMR